MARPPSCIYYDVGEKVDMRVGIFINEENIVLPEGSNLEITVVEGGRFAFFEFWGPYEGLHVGWLAFSGLMKQKKFNVDGRTGCIEVYVTDPGEVTDPNLWITEFYQRLDD